MPLDAFTATAYEMLAGGGLLILAGTGAGEWGSFHPAEVSTKAWIWLAYLVVIGSLVAFSAFVWLLDNAPISLVATYAYVNPVVAVALGALVLSEAITAAVVLGGLVVVVGVGLVVSGERHSPAPRSTGAALEREPVS
jgi:drug/metabolite transporter (DMT)-like permease